MLMCVVVEFALVLQAAGEEQGAVILFVQWCCTVCAPIIELLHVIALAYMCFLGTCPCVFFRPHFLSKAKCTISISLACLTPGKIHGFCIQNADYSAHC